MAKKKLTPRTATTFKQICSDGIETKDSWILIDGDTVYIDNQKMGEEPTGRVRLSRREFNRFVDWYNGVKP